MAWDENVCANTPAPEFTIPEDESFKDQILKALGYKEIEISETDKNGTTVRAWVLGRVEGESERKAVVGTAIVDQDLVG